MTETPETPETKPAEPPKGRVSITDDAKVMYQPDGTNPLPGDVVGVLKKGDHILDLNFEPALNVTFDGQLLADYVNEALAPLAGLANLDEAQPAVQEIAGQLRDGLGIVSRETMLSQISALDDEARALLRSKGVRFGPLYLFCYELNKPAAVRLRGLLYALYHEMDLPAPVPADGMVSKTAEEPVNKAFFEAIGYPVYGGRCIRIDMLDRVVNLVYESAEKGKFKAQHSMAEWLGCGIADLYAVLTDLGHTKVFDPADEVSEEGVEAADKKPDPPAPEGSGATSGEKPELATFVLKKGKKVVEKKSSKPKRSKPKGKGKSKKDRGPKVISAEAAPVSDEDSPWAALAALKK